MLISCLVAVGLVSASPEPGGVASGVLRERSIQDAAGSPFVALGAAVAFRPFADIDLRLVAPRFEPAFAGDLVVAGELEGLPGGWWRVVLAGDTLVGDVVAPSVGAFEVRPTASGGHVVRQVDREARSRCEGALTSAAPAPAVGALLDPGPTLSRRLDPDRPDPPDPDTATVVDVMVVYTASAAAAYGGESGTAALIDSFVAYTNGVYADCGAELRLRLVHRRQVAYIETGNILTDIARLRNPSDGFLDSIHTLRDAFGADCVSLLTTSGGAGTGYVMSPVSASFEDRAFSVLGAGTSSLAFAHELGHNMGCNHNNGPSVPPGAYCDSYGHRTPGGAWRTIMSYAPGTYVDSFSTPNKTFAGFPLGVDGTGCPVDGADNVRTLNGTREVVAAFRPTVVPR